MTTVRPSVAPPRRHPGPAAAGGEQAQGHWPTSRPGAERDADEGRRDAPWHAQRPRPLAYLVAAITPSGAGSTRGPVAELAPVVEEFGWRAHVGLGGLWPSQAIAAADEPLLEEASLVVFLAPGPDWMPAPELVMAAIAARSRIALVGTDIVLAGPVADMLAGADVVRYAPRRAGEALHAFLRRRQASGGELRAAGPES